MGRPKGYKMSEDAKRRISVANTGNHTSLGMKLSETTRKRMSESAKKAWARRKNVTN